MGILFAAPRRRTIHVQRLQERHKVGGFTRRELQRLQQAFAVGVQTINIQVRVMSHHLSKREHFTAVHVRPGITHVAQRRHFKFAEIAMLRFQVCGLGGAGARGIVVVRSQQIVFAGGQNLDAVVTAAVHPLTVTIDKMRHADIVKLAVGEHRPGVAGAAIAFADENLQAAPRLARIQRCLGMIAARQRIAKGIKRRVFGQQRFLKRRHHLAHAHQHRFVVLLRWVHAEGFFIAAR